MNEINKKLNAAIKLQEEAAAIIEKTYPKGSSVEFLYRDTQINPSAGIVAGVHKSGYYAGYLAIKTASGKIHHIHHGNVKAI